jgi:hypothetical protein
MQDERKAIHSQITISLLQALYVDMLCSWSQTNENHAYITIEISLNIPAPGPVHENRNVTPISHDLFLINSFECNRIFEKELNPAALNRQKIKRSFIFSFSILSRSCVREARARHTLGLNGSQIWLTRPRLHQGKWYLSVSGYRRKHQRRYRRAVCTGRWAAAR